MKPKIERKVKRLCKFVFPGDPVVLALHDSVARQYLGSIGKIENGIVSVNAYKVYENITFPLIFKVFKPRETLKESDKYKTKIELAAQMMSELIDFGFQIELVLSDSLSGESSQFIRTLARHKFPLVVAISL